MNIVSKLNHPSFKQPEDKQLKVWRYLSLEKFLNLALTKSLFFSRVDLLSDQHEGSYTKQLSSFNEDRSYKDAKGHSEFISDRRQRLRTTMFVNCWRIDNYESEAMWKVYCPDNAGLAIQTTYQKLVDSVIEDNGVYIGLVKYLDYEIGKFEDANILNPIMHKRHAFEHEKEVRIVKVNSDPWNDRYIEVTQKWMLLDWDPIQAIEKVYVNPYSDEWYFETIKTLFDRLKLGFIVEWSNIKSKPYF